MISNKQSEDGLLRLICAVVLVALIIWCFGCHTIHGVGQDLQDMTSDYVERKP